MQYRESTFRKKKSITSCENKRSSQRCSYRYTDVRLSRLIFQQINTFYITVHSIQLFVQAVDTARVKY